MIKTFLINTEFKKEIILDHDAIQFERVLEMIWFNHHLPRFRGDEERKISFSFYCKTVNPFDEEWKNKKKPETRKIASIEIDRNIITEEKTKSLE